jgi:hypothetical protein
MAIYFVDESIFDKKLQCVLCPVRGSQLFMYKEICGKIYDLADKAKLKRAYELNEACRYKCPIITPGFNLSEYIMHIVVPDMSASKHFEFDKHRKCIQEIIFIVKGKIVYLYNIFFYMSRIYRCICLYIHTNHFIIQGHYSKHVTIKIK